MTPSERLERVLKDLDRLTTETRARSKLLPSLETKVEAQRAAKVFTECRHNCRLQVFAMQDISATKDQE